MQETIQAIMIGHAARIAALIAKPITKRITKRSARNTPWYEPSKAR